VTTICLSKSTNPKDAEPRPIISTLHPSLPLYPVPRLDRIHRKKKGCVKRGSLAAEKLTVAPIMVCARLLL
jgi:hypothetical protein